MNKKVFMLPLVAMMLTGCGNKNYSALPKGGKEIDMSTEDGALSLAGKLARACQATYTGLGTGIKITETISKFNLDVKNTRYESNEEYPSYNEDNEENIKVKASGSITVAAGGLGGKLGGLKAALTLKDVGLDVNQSYTDNLNHDYDTSTAFSFSKLSTSLYLNEKNLYVDLSNKTIKNFALEMLQKEIGEEIPQEFLDQIFRKSYVQIINDEDAETVVLPEIPVESFQEVGSTFANFIYELAEAEIEFKYDLVTVKEYDDGSLGIGITIPNQLFKELETNEVHNEDPTDTDSLNVEISDDSQFSLAILFGEDGLLKSIGLKGKLQGSSVSDYHYEYGEETKYTDDWGNSTKALFEIDESTVFEYGPQKISFPDFSEYLPLLAEITLE